MATNASGREYKCIVGKQDVSALALGGDGDLADADFVSGSRLFMRLNQLNNINYDAAFTTASVMRSGRRAYEDGDFIRHYGSGVWTWDFDYLVENEVMLQTLLSLATGVSDCTGAITINSAVHDAFENLSHGQAAADNVGIILLEAGTSNTGYAPIIKNSGVTGAATASDFEKSIFDFASGALTVGSHAVTCTDFTMTITNEANRVGFQGTSAETDGYVRGGLFDISGSITVKYDANMADALSTDWKANTAYALALNDGANFDISIPSARMTGHNLDFADEGMFVEIPFTATTGPAASGSLAVITMT